MNALIRLLIYLSIYLSFRVRSRRDKFAIPKERWTPRQF